ncbi:MAG: zinc D-Ala-D-Ala dipeptidase [Sphingomonadales bacterium]|jgi:D-alanyl-D-alanine dipeptidase|nr:zinc D-Ala-D-Ala dipeptidase [Sphingomonadales bacterium]
MLAQSQDPGMIDRAFGRLAPLRERPLPGQKPALRLKKGYRNHPIKLDRPESGEVLVQTSDYGLAGENFYASSRNPPHYAPVPGAIPLLWVRDGVARRLARVDRRLARSGLGLWLFDGWRPTAVQTYFHDRWMPAMLRDKRPDLCESEIAREVGSYWAQPTTDPDAPSPHLTGAAVDLSLCWRDTKERLWLGSLFDDVNSIAHLDYFEGSSADEIAISHEEARMNRRLLYWVMVEAGFAANPSEWWHFSYGDQMWARLSGAESAFYGATAPPSALGAREAAE